jgi:hypothetical protein
VARTKKLRPEDNERARAFVAHIVERDFKGVELTAAKAFGISQSMLHEFLAGSRGAGMNILLAIADHAGVGVDVVLGRAAAGLPPLNRHPNWKKSREDAERDHPEIPVEWLDEVGKGYLPGALEEVDGQLVAGLAREWAAAEARAKARARRSAT